MKSDSISLMVREMQIETGGYNHTPQEWLKLRRLTYQVLVKL